MNKGIYAEATMMRLAEELGRQAAHDLINEAIEKSLSGISFQEALCQNKKITDTISKKEIKGVFQGKQHIKMTALMAQQVL